LIYMTSRCARSGGCGVTHVGS